MKRAVVDASVAAKWVVEEPDSDAAMALQECEALHAPSHWLAEAANVVWAKAFRGELSADQVRTRVALLASAPMRETAIADLMQAATDIALACRVTIYDALYVALAELLGLPLVTANRRLHTALNNNGRYAGVSVLLGQVAGCESPQIT
jgi:predicted nucleic acid-binding protein